MVDGLRQQLKLLIEFGLFGQLESRRLHDVGWNEGSGKVSDVCKSVNRCPDSYPQVLLCGIPEITAESKMTHGERQLGNVISSNTAKKNSQ
jgi:hypothetical protein